MENLATDHFSTIWKSIPEQELGVLEEIALTTSKAEQVEELMGGLGDNFRELVDKFSSRAISGNVIKRLSQKESGVIAELLCHCRTDIAKSNARQLVEQLDPAQDWRLLSIEAWKENDLSNMIQFLGTERVAAALQINPDKEAQTTLDEVGVAKVRRQMD